jgi:hypothetical protein
LSDHLHLRIDGLQIVLDFPGPGWIAESVNRLAYWSWGYQDISPNTLWALAGLTKFTKINGFQGSLQISGPTCHSSTVSWMLSEPPTQSCHP